jgi:hypothetical protein
MTAENQLTVFCTLFNKIKVRDVVYLYRAYIDDNQKAAKDFLLKILEIRARIHANGVTEEEEAHYAMV